MKILYFSFVEFDIPNACQTHTLGILKGFSSYKCQVHAVVPRSVNIRPKIENVRFYYLWPWQFTRIGKACFKLLSFCVMFLLCARTKYDVIYAREMEANPGPRFCSKVFKIPLYIEINDLIVPVLNENRCRSSLARRVRRHQESDFKQSSGLIIPSAPMCNWIIDKYGLPKAKVHMIINGTDLKESNNIVSSSEARNKLGIPPGCFALGFVGSIYGRYDFDTILQAIVESQNQIPDLYFVVVGDGPLTSKVKAKIRRLGLESRTIFTGYVQPDKLGNILPAIDIGLLCLTKKNAIRYGPITTKLSTYALHKLAVISAGLSLDGYPSGLVQGINLIPPEDPCALTDKIINLFNDNRERIKKACILHDFVIKNLTWKMAARETLKIIRHDLKSN